MKNEYIPDGEIWVLYRKKYKHPYHTWVESYEEVVKEVNWLRERKIEHEKILFYKPYDVFCGQKGEKVWFSFDLGNGHFPCPRYLWEFRTREEARIHIRKQKRIKNSVSLSEPIEYEKVGHFFNLIRWKKDEMRECI